MKRVIAFLFLTSVALCQEKPYLQRWSTTVTLDSSETKTMYLIHPGVDWIGSDKNPVLMWEKPDGDAAISKVDKRDLTGDVFVTVVPEAVTAEESDSLGTYMKPFSYEENTEEWYESGNDSTFLQFGKGIYTAASMRYLDWDDGEAYTIHLSGELWASPGIAFRWEQAADDVADADVKLNITVEIRR